MLNFIQRCLFNGIYAGFLLLASPWMLWRYSKGKSRRGWSQKLFGTIPERTARGKCLWLHAVSVGEVNLLRSVIDELLDAKPDLQIAISSSTETGFDLAKEKYSQHQVFFCPYDFSWAIQNVINRLKPSMVVLAELELWPNMIAVATKNRIPVAVINGRISENSYRGYQRFQFLTRGMFGDLSLALAQTQPYADRFVELGCDRGNVIATGSVKFDGSTSDRDNPTTTQLAIQAGFHDNDFVFVAGSTQLEEDLIAAKVYQRLKPTFPQLKLVLVPRHPNRCNALQQQLKQQGTDSTLRTNLGKTGTPHPLIVNVIGELGHWWGRANAAYVGGSMGNREGQNMIEPAAYGAPVAFGPRTKNFRDVVQQLLDEDASVVITNIDDLERFLRTCLATPKTMQAMGQRAQSVVTKNRGASKLTAMHLLSLIN